MMLDDVLQEIVEQLGSGGDTPVAWEQVRDWPEGALELFEKARWLKPTVAASSVECPGCEDNCYMPVHVLPAHKGRPARAYVACDQREDTGRVRIPMPHLRQWQIDDGELARWVGGALKLKGKPRRQSTGRAYVLGTLQGQEQRALLELEIADGVSLKASGHSLPLLEAVNCDQGVPRVDRDAVLGLVDSPPASKTKASTAAGRADKSARKTDAEIGTPEWRRQTASSAAQARHNKPGGIRDKKNKLREIWASGKYSSRDRCAEEECAALGISYATARKALRNTPEPKKH